MNYYDTDTTAELKLAAAYHIFLNEHLYPLQTLDQLVLMILHNYQDCQLPLITYAEEILLNSGKHSDDIIRGALVFLLTLPDEETSSTLKLAAVNHVFQYGQNFPSDIFLALAEMIICNSEDCQSKSLANGAKHILYQAREYCSESIRSASTYIIYNAAKFFIAAANDIVDTVTEYPKEVLKHAAFQFILINETFFKAPAINQGKFIAFFENLGKLDILTDYSTKLIDVLCSDD